MSCSTGKASEKGSSTCRHLQRDNASINITRYESFSLQHFYRFLCARPALPFRVSDVSPGRDGDGDGTEGG